MAHQRDRATRALMATARHEPTTPKSSKNYRLRVGWEETANQLRHTLVARAWREEWDELQINWDEELAACRTETDRIAVNLAYERACKALAERKPK